MPHGALRGAPMIAAFRGRRMTTDGATGAPLGGGSSMDMPYARIACCVDRDDMTDEILAEGMRLAGGDARALQVVHVVAPPHTLVAGPFAYIAPITEVWSQAETWLDARTRALPGATPVLLDGSPARALCEWAATHDIDLIVAAAHRGRVERAMLGGFASYIAYHAPCSVLLVHRRAGDAPTPPGEAAGANEIT
jgi:nucleotide-binding universal stress UspA family protein